MSHDESFVYTACPGWGDHDYCVVKTIVKDGKIIRAEKVDYPNKKLGCGHICQKGLEACKQPYNKHRLLHPLKRVGERGSGQFEEISWEQALDEIAAKMLELRKKYGPETVACWNMPAGPPPNNGLGTQLSSRLFGLWGATDPMLSYGLDNGPQYAGMYTFGNPLGQLMMDLRIIENADLVVIWGGNPVENQHRVASSIAAAKDNGARIIDFGLLFDGTAGFADQFVGVKPGTDAHLVLTMCRYLIEKNLIDRRFLIEHTNAPLLVDVSTGMQMRDDSGACYLAWDADSHTAKTIAPGQGTITFNAALDGTFIVDGRECKTAFQLLKEHVDSYTFEKNERITGVPAQIVIDFCEEYAATENSYILAPLGIRYQNQGEIYRCMYLLGALAGKLGGERSGVHTNVIASSAPIMFNNYAITRPLGPEGNKMKHMRQSEFFEQVQTADPYPIKAFWKGTGNPVHNCPNRGRWIETFNQMELVVDVDIWLTDTGELADYVLPDCMPYERLEIVDAANYGHIVLQEPAIEPMGEAKEPNFLYTELAKRLGLGEWFDKTTEEWLDIKLDTDFPPIAMIEPKVTVERLKKEKMIPILWPDPNYWDPLRGLTNVTTPDGRVDIYAERLVEVDAALPSYAASLETPTADQKDENFPYHFFSGRQRFFMQSMFTNDDLMIELSGKEPSARMNPADAAREKIADGDLVEVYNKRGHVVAPMRLDESIPPGSIQVWFGWRRGQFIEGTYSELLVPLGATETHNPVSELWYKHTEEMFGVDDMVNNYAIAYCGGWDTIWDCACNVRKYEKTTGEE